MPQQYHKEKHVRYAKVSEEGSGGRLDEDFTSIKVSAEDHVA